MTSKAQSVHSPPSLTPGGSRRLPPLLLSPNVLQNAAGVQQQGVNASSMGSQAMPGHSGVTPLLTGPSNGTSTPGFFLNLSKTGLTPNESNIRSGLTPGILTNSTGVNNGVAASVSLPGGQFTPGLSSLLGLPLADKQGSQNVALEANAAPLGNGLPNSVTASTSSTTVNSGSSGTPNMPLEMRVPSRKLLHNGSISGGTTATSSTGSDSTPSASKFNDGDAIKEPPHKRHKSIPKKSKKNEPGHEIRDEQERKRKEFLERNRVAASKFRKRKKEYIKKIESDVQFYEAEYDDLSQCMDKLCGISKQTINSSLLGVLKQALMRHDVNSALTLCNHMEQVLLQTKYVQRSGRNPRREDEEKRRRESPNEDLSDSNIMQPLNNNDSPRFSAGVHSRQLKHDNNAEGDDATGTINNLPLVINGNTLLSLDDIHNGAVRKTTSNLITENTLSVGIVP